MERDDFWAQKFLSRGLFLYRQNTGLAWPDLNLFWKANESTAGRDVHVYIIDSGLRSTHVEFGDKVNVIFDPFEREGEDSIGHGTAIASLVAGKTLGQAPNAELFICKIFDAEKKTSQEFLINALERVLQHHLSLRSVRPNLKSILNLSLSTAPSAETKAALDKLTYANILVVLAVDNVGRDSHLIEVENNSAVITVAGIDSQANSIMDFKADVFAPGRGVMSATSKTDESYKALDGNSMAAALVTGVIAAAWSKTSTFNAADMKSYILTTCEVVDGKKVIQRRQDLFTPVWSTAETGIIETLKPNQYTVRPLKCKSLAKDKVKFRIIAGALPRGLNLSEDGVIIGTAVLSDPMKEDDFNYFSTVIRAENQDGFSDRNISLIVTTNFTKVRSSHGVIPAVQLAKCNVNDAVMMMNLPDNQLAPGQDAPSGMGDTNFFPVAIDCCFTGNSQVRMHDGTTRSISKIKVGDFVHQKSRAAKVLAVIAVPLKAERQVYQLNNFEVFVTDEHPFYGANGEIFSIKPAQQLPFATKTIECTTKLVGFSAPVEINQIKVINYLGPALVYHLYTDGDGSYFVGDLLTHRKNLETIAEIPEMLTEESREMANV